MYRVAGRTPVVGSGVGEVVGRGSTGTVTEVGPGVGTDVVSGSVGQLVGTAVVPPAVGPLVGLGVTSCALVSNGVATCSVGPAVGLGVGAELVGSGIGRPVGLVVGKGVHKSQQPERESLQYL